MCARDEWFVAVVCSDQPDRTARLCSVRGLLLKLPPANHAVLKYIVTHLYRSVYLPLLSL